MQNIRIEINGAIGTKVWIDDVEQTEIHEVRLKHTAGEAPILELERFALKATAEGSARVNNIEICPGCKGKLCEASKLGDEWRRYTTGDDPVGSADRRRSGVVDE